MDNITKDTLYATFKQGIESTIDVNDKNKRKTAGDKWKALEVLLSMAKVIDGTDTLCGFCDAVLQPEDANLFRNEANYKWGTLTTIYLSLGRARDILNMPQVKELCSHDDKLTLVCTSLNKIEHAFKTKAKSDNTEKKTRARKKQEHSTPDDSDSVSIQSDTATDDNIIADVKKAHAAITKSLKYLLMAKGVLHAHASPSIAAFLDEPIESLQNIEFSQCWKDLIDA
jgi:hypothetical protein